MLTSCTTPSEAKIKNYVPSTIAKSLYKIIFLQFYADSATNKPINMLMNIASLNSMSRLTVGTGLIHKNPPKNNEC